MHVLIVEDVRHERELLARHLAAAGHDVSQAADARAGLQYFAERPPEVLLTDWGLSSGPSGLDLIKRIRSIATPHYVYCIVVTGRTNAADIAQVFASGADDFLRKPVFREELIARVEAPKRIAEWAPRLAASATVHDFTGRYDGTHLKAWKEVEQVVTADISDMLGQNLTVDAGKVTPVVMSAEIPLSLPAEQLEFRISVGFDQGARAKLGEVLLGDPSAPDAAMSDVVREIANTAGGAFKRAALSEGIALTTGLPTNGAGARDGSDATAAKVRPWVGRSELGFGLTFTAQILSRKNQRVTAHTLREGMVIARDLKNEAGVLLIPAGTRLTSSTVERLTKLLGATFLVEVANAA